jgi:FkbM family methyltransferase
MNHTQTPKVTVDIFDTSGERYLLHSGPDLINQTLKTAAWEPATQQIAKLFLDTMREPTVLDIGGNLGAFTVPIGRYIQNFGGTLHAFEPQRMLYYQLCGNIFVNQLSNCRAHHLALGAEEGTIDVPQLQLGEHSNLGALSLDRKLADRARNAKTFEPVPLKTLDALNLPPADLIKIDIEGMELPVLQGGRAYLERSGWPVMLLEVWGPQYPTLKPWSDALLDYVRQDLGYECQILGELGIAQHPVNMPLLIQPSKTPNSLDFSRSPNRH